MILAISKLVTKDSREVILEHISYKRYPILFQKDKGNILALLNLDSKINVINFVYTKKLGLYVRKTNGEPKKWTNLIWIPLRWL